MHSMYTMTLNMYITENVSATKLDANIIFVASDGQKNQKKPKKKPDGTVSKISKRLNPYQI